MGFLDDLKSVEANGRMQEQQRAYEQERLRQERMKSDFVDKTLYSQFVNQLKDELKTKVAKRNIDKYPVSGLLFNSHIYLYSVRFTVHLSDNIQSESIRRDSNNLLNICLKSGSLTEKKLTMLYDLLKQEAGVGFCSNFFYEVRSAKQFSDKIYDNELNAKMRCDTACRIYDRPLCLYVKCDSTGRIL